MTRCVCGNPLPSSSSIRVIMSPCRCDHPGAGPRVSTTPGTLPTFMHDSAVKERRAAGLPDCTDYERGVSARWI